MNRARVRQVFLFVCFFVVFFALPSSVRSGEMVSCQKVSIKKCLEIYKTMYAYQVVFKQNVGDAVVTASFPKNDKYIALANILEAAKIVNYTLATNEENKSIVVDMQFDGNAQVSSDAAAKAVNPVPSDEQLKILSGKDVTVDLEQCANRTDTPGNCVTLRQIKILQEQALLKQRDPKTPVLPNDPKSITYEQLKALRDTKIDVPPTGKVTLGVTGETTPTNQQLDKMRKTQVTPDPQARVIPGDEHSITIEQLQRLRDQGGARSRPAGSGS